MNNKYLPIGSIIKIFDAESKIMVLGYMAKSKSSNILYEYIGCLYPQGYQVDDNLIMFNHKQISEIFYIGDSTNEKFKEYNELLLKEMVMNND